MVYESYGIEYARETPRMQRLSTRLAYKIKVHKKASVRSLINVVLPHLVVKDREAVTLKEFLDRFPDDARSGAKVPDHDKIELIEKVRSLKRIA